MNNVKYILEYAKNQIIVTGYFNPLPNLKEYKDQIDEVAIFTGYTHAPLSLEEMERMAKKGMERVHIRVFCNGYILSPLPQKLW